MNVYPVYKESGVDWLGEIPEHWEVKKLKYVGQAVIGLTYKPENVTDEETGTLVFRASNVNGGKLVYKDNVFVQMKIPEHLITKAGDILICVRSGSRHLIGKNALIEEDSAGHSFGAFMTVFRSNVNNFLSHVFKSQLFEVQSGLFNTSTVNQLTQSSLYNFQVAFPPLPEQQAIADFLDRKTTQIDTLIEKKQRQIELLQEQRTALINQAVTKGLDPTVPMKDSGIEWYGKIPEHWQLKRLGWITSLITDIDHKMPSAIEEGIPFLSAKDLLNDGTLNFEVNVKKISEEDFQKLSRKVQPRRNDIIYSRIGARLGKARLVETDVRFLVSYSCCVVRVIEGMALPEYVCFILDSELVLTEAKARTVGIGVPDLGLGEIARFPIPVPPKDEQKQILDYLREQVGKIRLAEEKVATEIGLLQEYRTALISAAVTGKIDVRE